MKASANVGLRSLRWVLEVTRVEDRTDSWALFVWDKERDKGMPNIGNKDSLKPCEMGIVKVHIATSRREVGG